MVGQRIVDSRLGQVQLQEFAESTAVALVMHHGAEVRALHDAGEKDVHGRGQRSGSGVGKQLAG